MMDLNIMFAQFAKKLKIKLLINLDMRKQF